MTKIEALRKKKLLVFDVPHYVKIEATHGCNRRCKFCAATINKSKIHRMPFELFKKIVNDLDERTKRMDFILHGEPLLNSKLPEFCAYARKYLPKVQLSTISNVDKLTKMDKSLEFLIEMFRAGLNYIHVDLYEAETKELFFALLSSKYKTLGTLGVEFLDYYQDNINIFAYHGHRHKAIIICDEINKLNSQEYCTRSIHTCGGDLPLNYIKTFVPLKSFPMHKSCTEPLKYMSIGSHGDCLICCRDWAEAIDMGNASNNNVIDIWQSDFYHMVRWVLRNKRRDLIAPCYLCNYRSFRDGLYPYWGPERTESMEKLHDTICRRTSIQFQLRKNLEELGVIDELPGTGR